MMDAGKRFTRWIGWAVLTAALAACGGGGDGPATPLPAPQPDARNGSYVMMAADAREYELRLDFDAGTYRVVGANNVDTAGTFVASGDTFLFVPGNAIGATGVNTTRFTLVDGAIVGQFALPAGALPFIAARSFTTTVAGATGKYNILGRTVDNTGAPVNTTIQQAEITAEGTLRTCEEMVLYEIASCPTVRTGTLTVADGVFTSNTPDGAFTFRMTEIGGTKVLLRGSASTTTTRRFMVGMPVASSFAAGSFTGGTSEPAWSTVTVGNGNFSSVGVMPNGVASNLTGTTRPAGAATLNSLLILETTANGNFFAIRSAELGMVLAARSNPVAPGFVAIGKRQ